MGPAAPKIVPTHAEISTTSNTWFLGPTQVYPPIGISMSSAVFAGLVNVTNRHGDHATLSVGINAHLMHRQHAVQPNGTENKVASTGNQRRHQS